MVLDLLFTLDLVAFWFAAAIYYSYALPAAVCDMLLLRAELALIPIDPLDGVSFLFAFVELLI